MSRIAFSIFGLDIMWYGILIAFGMALAVTISTKEAKRLGYKEDVIMDLSLFIILFGVLGARIYYVAFNLNEYHSFFSIINIREGGLAIHGGIIAGIITTLVYSKIKKINFFILADMVVLGVPLAQAIGRWGNFINGEAHGGVTSLPWAIVVDGQRVHPTFLYESIWDFLIFLALYFCLRKRKKYDGQVLVFYLIFYSLGRFFIESIRTDSLMFGFIRVAQLVSVLGILAGIVIHLILKKRKKNGI